MDSEGEGEGGMIWENGIETCILSCKKEIANLCSMLDAGCLGLVHGDDPEGCGVGGGRGLRVWSRLDEYCGCLDASVSGAHGYDYLFAAGISDGILQLFAFPVGNS